MSRLPHPKALGLPEGITEAMIESLVRTFYAAVRADAVLGPIFARHIDDWDAHIEKLCAFWSSVTLMTGRYKGRPMQAHAAICGLSAAHFERWLGLFRQTAWSHCPPGAARVFEDRALRIAASLQAGLNIPHAAPPALHTTGG